MELLLYTLIIYIQIGISSEISRHAMLQEEGRADQRPAFVTPGEISSLGQGELFRDQPCFTIHRDII